MKFASYTMNGRPGWGALIDGEVFDLSRLAPGLRAALAQGSLPGSRAAVPGDAPVHSVLDMELRPPVPDTGRIFCIGPNYAEHRKEMGHAPTGRPVVFMRFAQSVAGQNRDLYVPPESTAFDFEGELAVIIGTAGRRIREADALRHVAGYACFMDGSVRDWQMHTDQYTPGKNFDRSGAFGPWLVTADEIGDPNGGLLLQTRLNGDVMQKATTDQMIFSVPVLIAYLSTFTLLQPGDVITTGTPGGVGFKRNPPLYLRDGDRIEVEIDKIGVLANTIRDEP
ncbi:MAG: fumarylacetoacetate hydrolase family protein [Gammaproteobacteria bacterium]|nr:fumarylacetoacetate hydrolase family protein [Gammaproteobacteria bacterium]